nr:unnamed protein product [Digitaria exilis]CAB3497532.1 unnamed protein product [Digitaria exilis]
MLRSGQSFEAERYLDRFLPPIAFRERSPLCMLLLVHVRIVRILSTVAAGGPSGAGMAALFANPMDYLLESAYSVRLHKTVARMHADQTRASMLWQKIQPGALDKIMDMVARCPELKGEVRVPRKRPLLWDAAPNGLRQCPSRCRNATKRAPSNVLIRTFLQKRLLLVQGKTHADVDEECKQALTSLNFSTEDAEKMLKKAFGWIHSPYWSEERNKEVPSAEVVTGVLNYIRSLGLSDEDLHKLLKKFPEVLGCDLDREVKLNVSKLDSDWGINGKTLRSLLLRNPKVLGYNIDCRGDCMAQCTRCWVRF